MRVVYAGTPTFALPALETLLTSLHEVVAVCTKPDQLMGRGRSLGSSPVKRLAIARQLPVYQPINMRDPEFIESLRTLAPDVLINVACGFLIPEVILTLPRYGCLNIHPSLLPRWRGAAPLQRALLAGDQFTGVSIMRLDAGLDTGPVFLQQALAILPSDTGASLSERAAELGAHLLLQVLTGLERGVQPAPQREQGVTYADKLTKLEGKLDWSLDAEVLDRQIRGLNPWPVAYTFWQGNYLRILQSALTDRAEDALPGTIVNIGGDKMELVTGNQRIVRLLTVQPENGKLMSAGAWARGARGLTIGSVLG